MKHISKLFTDSCYIIAIQPYYDGLLNVRAGNQVKIVCDKS